ncbi:MAG: TetR/AcrR family transcriptional regulator [Pseudomonadota bacterium]
MARKIGSNGERTAGAVRRAAIQLIARYGFAAVSMRQIAAEIGVQAGALYLYTPDKQSLLRDIMEDHLERLLAAWDAVAPSGASPEERLEAFVRFHVRYHIDRRDEVAIAYMELRNLTPENFRTIEAQRRAYEDILCDILRDGAAAGTFDVPEPRIATRGLIAMLTGVTTWFRRDGPLDIDEIAETYLAMARGAVGLRAPALA